MTPSSSPLLSFLYQALASPFGISLSVSDVGQAKTKLYSARKDSADEALSQISIHQSPYLPEEELWLVKRPKRGQDGPASDPADSPQPASDDESAGRDNQEHAAFD